MARGKKKLTEVNDLTLLLEQWRAEKLKLLSVEDVLSMYEQIIELCVEGYDETVVTPKGEPVTIVKRDLRTAIAALKEHRNLVNELVAQGDDSGVSVSINVGLLPRPVQATSS